MEINRNELGSELCEGNGAKFIRTISVGRFIFDGDIPEWLLAEVLIRLPAKVVFRFKLVCKKWLFVISDPSFVRMYVSRALMLPQRWTLIFYDMYPYGYQHMDIPGRELFVDINSEDLKCPGMYVIPCPKPDKKYSVLGVSNGLVLYRKHACVEDHGNYGIINPVTGQCIAVPLHRDRAKLNRGFATHVENGILTSYRIVQLDAASQINMINLEVFVSETCVWQNFAVHTDHKISVSLRLMATELNGILHWTSRKDGIIAYDAYQKPDCLRFVALPGDEDLNSFERGKRCIFPSLCDVHEGQLRYFEISSDVPHHGLSRFSVWILNDYSVGEWCLLYRFSSADVLKNDMFSRQWMSLVSVSLHPFDPEILYLGYGKMLYSFSMKFGKLEVQGGLDVRAILGVKELHWKLVSLLVIPPWPVYIPPPTFEVSTD